MITASLATIPTRDATATINSLKSQVDQLIVTYNMTASANEKYGDMAKFIPLAEINGYLFTCDDDLIYPPDYVKRMVEEIEKHNRFAFITLHGRTFERRKIKSYYRDKKEGFRCLGSVEKNTIVNSGGTGVMAWHSDLFRPLKDYFKRANMADIWLAKFAKENNIPIVCIEHREGWLKYIEQPENTTIWEKKQMNDEFETKIFNSFWP